jgi:IclR family acetate operon transcriptional repressor
MSNVVRNTGTQRRVPEGERGLKTVAKAAALLRHLAEASGPLGVTELAVASGLGKSTTHLLLRTLVRERLVDAEQGRYRLGLGTFELGAAAVDQLGYGTTLAPPMEALARRTDESVSLGVLSGDSMLFVQRVESPEILRADIRPGTRLSLHSSATGRALLSAMPILDVMALFPREALPPGGHGAPRTRTELLVRLDRDREVGYTTACDEFVSGISALAAPVRGTGGRAAAAVSVASPNQRFRPEAWIAPLLEAAAAMSALLGYRQ